jgi:anti-sigma B factor antagonist
VTIPASPADRLAISVNGSTFALEGEVDPHTAPMLDEQLETFAPDGTLSLDLTGVTFMDSAGLRVLVRQQRRLGDAGGRLVITRASDPTRKLLELTGMWEVLGGSAIS